MKTNTKRRQSSLPITNARWLTYTTAAAATALGCAGSAEASLITVEVNQTIAATPGTTYFGGGGARATFGLDSGHYFVLQNAVSYSGRGLAQFALRGEAFRGFSRVTSYGYQFAYPSKLALGADIADGPFAVKDFGALAFPGYTQPQFEFGGRGYIGFRFSDAAGVEYGWADVSTNGQAAGSNITLYSYAYTTAGEVITAGQTSLVPEPGSLALLALGGAGLLAWRQGRAKSAVLPG